MSSYSEEANRDPRYRKLKKQFKHGKVCANCGELKADEMTIDHIIPMWHFKGSYSDTDNWQVLCLQCHRIKTREEGFGVGYIHESIGRETITETEEITTPVWFGLYDFIDRIKASSIDVYLPSDNYLKYLIDQFSQNEKQKKAIATLKTSNKKLKSLLSVKDNHSPLMMKFATLIESFENGSPLSEFISDDDSYLVINGDFENNNYVKLDASEYLPVLNHYFNEQDTPSEMTVFLDGVPETLANHAVYVSDNKGNDRIPAIARLGTLTLLELSLENTALEVIYNPETLKFALSYKK